MNKKQWIVFIIAVIVISLYGLTALELPSGYRDKYYLFWAKKGTNAFFFRDMFYFWLLFIIGFFFILFWAVRKKTEK